MLIIIPVLFLLASIYALCDAIVMRSTRFHGYKSYAKIVKVEHTIPFGFRRFLSKRDGSIGCDYVVRISFPTKEGRCVSTKTTVHARMKIANGKRIPFFVEDNRVPIRYHRLFQKVVYFDVDPIKERQGTFAPVVVWGSCVLLLSCIVAYMLFA